MYLIFLGFIFTFGTLAASQTQGKLKYRIIKNNDSVPIIEAKGRLYVPFIVKYQIPTDFSSTIADSLRTYVKDLLQKHNLSTKDQNPNGDQDKKFFKASNRNVYLSKETAYDASSNGKRKGIPVIMSRDETNNSKLERVIGIPVELNEVKRKQSAAKDKSKNILKMGSGVNLWSPEDLESIQLTKPQRGISNEKKLWIKPEETNLTQKSTKLNLFDRTNGGLKLIGKRSREYKEVNEYRTNNTKSALKVNLGSIMGLDVKPKVSNNDNFFVWEVPGFYKGRKGIMPAEQPVSYINHSKLLRDKNIEVAYSILNNVASRPMQRQLDNYNEKHRFKSVIYSKNKNTKEVYKDNDFKPFTGVFTQTETPSKQTRSELSTSWVKKTRNGKPFQSKEQRVLDGKDSGQFVDKWAALLASSKSYNIQMKTIPKQALSDKVKMETRVSNPDTEKSPLQQGSSQLSFRNTRLHLSDLIQEKGNHLRNQRFSAKSTKAQTKRNKQRNDVNTGGIYFEETTNPRYSLRNIKSKKVMGGSKNDREDLPPIVIPASIAGSDLSDITEALQEPSKGIENGSNHIKIKPSSTDSPLFRERFRKPDSRSTYSVLPQPTISTKALRQLKKSDSYIDRQHDKSEHMKNDGSLQEKVMNTLRNNPNGQPLSQHIDKNSFGRNLEKQMSDKVEKPINTDLIPSIIDNVSAHSQTKLNNAVSETVSKPAVLDQTDHSVKQDNTKLAIDTKRPRQGQRLHQDTNSSQHSRRLIQDRNRSQQSQRWALDTKKSQQTQTRRKRPSRKRKERHKTRGPNDQKQASKFVRIKSTTDNNVLPKDTKEKNKVPSEKVSKKDNSPLKMTQNDFKPNREHKENISERKLTDRNGKENPNFHQFRKNMNYGNNFEEPSFQNGNNQDTTKESQATLNDNANKSSSIAHEANKGERLILIQNGASKVDDTIKSNKDKTNGKSTKNYIQRKQKKSNNDQENTTRRKDETNQARRQNNIQNELAEATHKEAKEGNTRKHATNINERNILIQKTEQHQSSTKFVNRKTLPVFKLTGISKPRTNYKENRNLDNTRQETQAPRRKSFDMSENKSNRDIFDNGSDQQSPSVAMVDNKLKQQSQTIDMVDNKSNQQSPSFAMVDNRSKQLRQTIDMVENKSNQQSPSVDLVGNKSNQERLSIDEASNVRVDSRRKKTRKRLKSRRYNNQVEDQYKKTRETEMPRTISDRQGNIHKEEESYQILRQKDQLLTSIPPSLPVTNPPSMTVTDPRSMPVTDSEHFSNPMRLGNIVPKALESESQLTGISSFSAQKVQSSKSPDNVQSLPQFSPKLPNDELQDFVSNSPETSPESFHKSHFRPIKRLESNFQMSNPESKMNQQNSQRTELRLKSLNDRNLNIFDMATQPQREIDNKRPTLNQGLRRSFKIDEIVPAENTEDLQKINNPTKSQLNRNEEQSESSGQRPVGINDQSELETPNERRNNGQYKRYERKNIFNLLSHGLIENRKTTIDSAEGTTPHNFLTSREDISKIRSHEQSLSHDSLQTEVSATHNAEVSDNIDESEYYTESDETKNDDEFEYEYYDDDVIGDNKRSDYSQLTQSVPSEPKHFGDLDNESEEYDYVSSAEDSFYEYFDDDVSEGEQIQNKVKRMHQSRNIHPQKVNDDSENEWQKAKSSMDIARAIKELKQEVVKSRNIHSQRRHADSENDWKNRKSSIDSKIEDLKQQILRLAEKQNNQGKHYSRDDYDDYSDSGLFYSDEFYDESDDEDHSFWDEQSVHRPKSFQSNMFQRKESDESSDFYYYSDEYSDENLDERYEYQNDRHSADNERINENFRRYSAGNGRYQTMPTADHYQLDERLEPHIPPTFRESSHITNYFQNQERPSTNFVPRKSPISRAIVYYPREVIPQRYTSYQKHPPPSYYSETAPSTTFENQYRLNSRRTIPPKDLRQRDQITSLYRSVSRTRPTDDRTIIRRHIPHRQMRQQVRPNYHSVRREIIRPHWRLCDCVLNKKAVSTETGLCLCLDKSP